MLEASGTLGSSLLCLASSSTTEYTSLLLVGGADNPSCPGAGIQYVSMGDVPVAHTSTDEVPGS